jgi:hypothetical protein
MAPGRVRQQDILQKERTKLGICAHWPEIHQQFDIWRSGNRSLLQAGVKTERVGTALNLNEHRREHTPFECVTAMST